ncbi:unnamed protein product [Schistosoma turkestanicum]|nr:unnamed protein product [Schistosoma turkestanicum]
MKSLSLQRRLKQTQHYHFIDVNEKLLKANEFNNQDENNFSAGSILIAIVALSCAIILVLLGITVYVCGRRGFQNFRQNNNNNNTHINGRIQYLTRNHNSLNSIKLTNEKVNWKNILNSESNTVHINSNCDNESYNPHVLPTPTMTLYPNKSILIDKDSESVLRYHLNSNESTILNNENNPYVDQTDSVHLKSIIIGQNQFKHRRPQQEQQDYQTNHEGYTTFLPLSERSSSNCHPNYTTLPLEANHSSYVSMPISLLSNDEFKQNCEKGWTLSGCILPQYNQYEQKIISFINSNEYSKQSHERKHSEEHKFDGQSNPSKVNNDNLTVTPILSVHTSTTNTNAAADNNINSTDTTDMVNSNIITNNKTNAIPFTQSLKMKKSHKLQFDDSFNLVNNHVDNNLVDCTLNKKHAKSLNEMNHLKTARSWEYIVIPEIDQPLSPLSSNIMDHNITKEQQHKASWIPIASSKLSTISSVQKPIIHDMNHDSSDNQPLNNTDSSKYITNKNSTHLQTFHQPVNSNSSILHLYNAQNIPDYNSSRITTNQPIMDEQINQSNDKFNLYSQGQSITPVNLIDLMDKRICCTKSCDCGKITNNSLMNHSQYPMNMMNLQHPYSDQEQNNQNNSPVTTDFV